MIDILVHIAITLVNKFWEEKFNFRCISNLAFQIRSGSDLFFWYPNPHPSIGTEKTLILMIRLSKRRFSSLTVFQYLKKSIFWVFSFFVFDFVCKKSFSFILSSISKVKSSIKKSWFPQNFFTPYNFFNNINHKRSEIPFILNKFYAYKFPLN